MGGLGFRVLGFREQPVCKHVGEAGSGRAKALPIGSKVVPFCGLYLDSYRVIRKRNYLGAYGYPTPLMLTPLMPLKLALPVANVTSLFTELRGT